MKIVAGATIAFAALGVFAYSISGSDTVIPEKADPNFNYDGASYADKKAWMNKFANRFIVAGAKGEKEHSGPKRINVKYSIDTHKRHLIVDMTPIDKPSISGKPLNADEKLQLRQTLKRQFLENCRRNIESAGIVGNAAIVFRVHVGYPELPVISVPLSKKSCAGSRRSKSS